MKKKLLPDGDSLNPLPKDDRDFSLGAIFSLPDLSELPETFRFEPISIKDQNADGNDDFCSACATTAMSELQEETELYYPFSFAASKEISGGHDEWGQNMRDAFKAHVKYGAISAEDVPEEVKKLSSQDKRFLKNYPEWMLEKAKLHKKQSFFVVTGPYDHYDNLRAALWKFRDKKQAVGIGVRFGWDLYQYDLTGTPEYGFGHMMYAIGWDKNGVFVPNSSGRNVGKNGEHRVSRETINAFADKWGLMMMVDMPKETAQTYIKYGFKDSDGLFVKLIKMIGHYLFLWRN